jgi:hypothetical protein
LRLRPHDGGPFDDRSKRVVSGVNYPLESRVKRDGKEHNALAVVWLQSWRTLDPYRLTSWERN